MPGLKLQAELGGDGSGFDAMMRRADKTKDKFAASFAGLKGLIAGAFTVGAVTNLSRQTLELAGHLRDVSDALGVNVEWFQKRANAAKLAGGSEEDLTKFIDTMTRSREDAFNNPDGDAAKRLGRLGFSPQDISGLNTMDFFDRLVKAYSSGADSQAAVDVEKIGGKAARNLLAAFQTGLEGGGPIMSEDLVNQLDEIGDEFEIFKQTLLTGLAPVLGGVVTSLQRFIGWLKVFMASIGGEQAGHVRKTMLEGMEKSNDPMIRRFAKEQLKKFNEAGGVEGYAGQLVEEELKKQQDEAERIRKARQAERAARRNRENRGPNFERKDDSEKPEKEKRLPALTTDSLVGVSNFLGRNPSLVNTIANQQLTVAREQLVVLRSMLEHAKAKKVMPEAQTLQIPAT